MSSGNKLSVSICDDNGNLSYQKQYSVRRIIQRGVIDNEQLVSLDMEELGYYQSSDKRFIADPDKTTGKFLLIAEYDSGRDDETDIIGIIPADYNDKTNPPRFIIYDGILNAACYTSYYKKTYYALSSGNDGEWVDGDKFCLEVGKANMQSDGTVKSMELAKFDFVKIKDGVISAVKDMSDESDTVFYLTNNVMVVKTFRGDRWFCVMPLVIDNRYGCQIFFRRKINGGLIRYFAVEVEE